MFCSNFIPIGDIRIFVVSQMFFDTCMYASTDKLNREFKLKLLFMQMRKQTPNLVTEYDAVTLTTRLTIR